MNVVITGSGKIVEVMASGEREPIDLKTFNKLLELSISGALEVLKAIKKLYEYDLNLNYFKKSKFKEVSNS